MMSSVFSQQVRTTSIVSLVLAFLAVSTNAQTNPRQKPSPEPTPKTDLLIVNPATPVASPVAAPTPPAGAQEKQPENEIDDKQPVITTTDLITFNVTVTDVYGRFVSGLKQSAFSVLDDKHPEEITFFSDDDAPVSVGILFDLTGSMSGEKVQRAKNALSHFIETSHKEDEYFLI